MAPAKKQRDFGRRKQTREPLPLWAKQAIVGVVIVVVVGLLGTAVWYGSRIPSLQITTIEVTGGETIERRDIHELATEMLAGTYLHLVPKRFGWFYPEETIEQRIQTIDRVKTVEVDRDGQTVDIHFTEYIPAALWCDSTNESCVYLDADGYAFTKAPQLSGEAFVRYIHPTEPVATGKSAFAAEFMSETRRFAALLAANFDWYVTRVIKGEREDVTYEVAGGSSLKTSQDHSTEETLENLQTILTSQEFTDLTPGNFQYIDLRFGNKVYVNEEFPATASSSATSTATSSESTNAE